MLEQIRELFLHLAWTDDLLWNAVRSCPSAGGDRELRERLYRLHALQHSFLQLWQARSIAPAGRDEVAALAALEAYGRAFHVAARNLLDAVTDARLADEVPVPFYPGSPRHGVGATMLHVIIASVYEQGRAASRLRELGSDPAPADLLAWVGRGRPLPAWLRRP